MEISPERWRQLSEYAVGLRATAPVAVVGAAADLLLGEEVLDWVCLTFAGHETAHWALTWLTPTRLIHVQAQKTQRIWWSQAADGEPDVLSAWAAPRTGLEAVEVVASSAAGDAEDGVQVDSTYRLVLAGGRSIELGQGYLPGHRGTERLAAFVAAVSLG